MPYRSRGWLRYVMGLTAAPRIHLLYRLDDMRCIIAPYCAIFPRPIPMVHFDI
nr:MAG TPA: hypothetical protein [Caudoviricetes sp.]